MEISSAVKKATAAFREHRDREDAHIVCALVQEGVASDLAERLVEFVPLAFFRATMLKRPGQFADHYVRMRADGSFSGERKLAAEPVYVAALSEAQAEMKAGVPREVFLLVAGRSSELAAASQLAASGGNPADAIFSPPVFTRWVDDDPAAARDPPTPRWWQFWK